MLGLIAVILLMMKYISPPLRLYGFPTTHTFVTVFTLDHVPRFIRGVHQYAVTGWLPSLYCPASVPGQNSRTSPPAVPNRSAPFSTQTQVAGIC